MFYHLAEHLRSAMYGRLLRLQLSWSLAYDPYIFKQQLP